MINARRIVICGSHKGHEGNKPTPKRRVLGNSELCSVFISPLSPFESRPFFQASGGKKDEIFFHLLISCAGHLKNGTHFRRKLPDDGPDFELGQVRMG